MGKVELKKGIYWVGAIDWNIRIFHGYDTPEGTTYNAYLIVDEKIALIDTVKAPFFEEMVQRIEEIIPLDKIDYLISNHVEKDHSGSLARTKELAKNATIIATERGKKGLTRYYKKDWPFQTVKTGDTLDLGSRQVAFVEVPMVHWPDSMVTYSPSDKILFSNDAFGQHLASSKRFDDEVGWDIIQPEAATYYANIVLHLGQPVLKALEAAKGLDLEIVAPCHGVIWRKNIDKIVSSYVSWAQHEAKEKVLIIYDTMWKSTEKMAKAMIEGVREEGVEVKLMNITQTGRTVIMKEVLDAKALVIGSPTLNNGLYPTVADFLCYMKGLRPQKKICYVFGSFGWGGGATKAITEELKATGLEVVEPPLQFQFLPDPEELEQCKELGKKVAARVKE
jgi:flavorubredoxin